MKVRSIVVVAMLLLASLGLLAACGGSDDDDADGGSSTPAATTAPADGDGSDEEDDGDGDSDGDDSGGDTDGDGAGGQGSGDYLAEVTAVVDSGMELLAGFLPYAALGQQRQILDEITAAYAELDPPDDLANGHDLLGQSIALATEAVEYQESLDSFGGPEGQQTAEYFSEISDLYYEARAELGID